MLNNLNGMNNLASNNLIANPFATINPQIRSTLGLNQIEGFKPVEKFIDDTNTEWTLIKSSDNSSLDIPDPKNIQITDFWNHEFPRQLKNKLYIYVVEGIRQPRVETEKPSRVLYQWFSTNCLLDFNPSMITEKEWLKANVYSALVLSARTSKLNALCHVETPKPANQPQEEDSLLKIEELASEALNGNTESSK